MPAVPMAIRIPPAKRRGCSARKAGFIRQWEIHQGTNPATKPGAMTRKTAEPAIAATFLIRCSLKQVCRRNRSPPTWESIFAVSSEVTGHGKTESTLHYHARCCDVEDWPDADQFDCCRLLETHSGMAVGCGADNRRAPSPSNRENPPQIQSGVCRLPEGGLCKSYTLRTATRKVYNAVCIVMQGVRCPATP